MSYFSGKFQLQIVSSNQWYGLSRPDLYIQRLTNQQQRGKLFYGTPGILDHDKNKQKLLFPDILLSRS